MRLVIELYHPEMITYIRNILKDMFAATTKDMLQAELEVPHDRECDYESKFIPPRTKDVNGLKAKILSFNAKGTGHRDI